MADDRVLKAVIRLRRLLVDATRAAVAAHIQDETERARRAAEAEAALVRERLKASSLLADDAAVEAFAAWLPNGRKAADRARAAQTEALARVDRARAELAAARAAAEAAERLLADREAAEHALQARAEQAGLDECGTRRSGNGG